MISLSDFISKLGEAGVEASKACEKRSFQRIRELCDEDKDGNLTPKVVSIKIGDRQVDVPLLSLLPHTRVDIDAFTAKFNATLQLEEHIPDPMVCAHHGLRRKGIEVEATISFKSGANVEAIELLREKLNKELNSALSEFNDQEKK